MIFNKHIAYVALFLSPGVIGGGGGGHNIKKIKLQLKPLFDQAYQQINKPKVIKNQVFFKVPFDPNGPSKTQLKTILQFSKLLPLMKPYGVDQLSICYLKPPTLKRKLCKTTFDTDILPTPASKLKNSMPAALPAAQ